jgi:hypothetical protein
MMHPWCVQVSEQRVRLMFGHITMTQLPTLEMTYLYGVLFISLNVEYA